MKMIKHNTPKRTSDKRAMSTNGSIQLALPSGSFNPSKNVRTLFNTFVHSHRSFHWSPALLIGVSNCNKTAFTTPTPILNKTLNNIGTINIFPTPWRSEWTVTSPMFLRVMSADSQFDKKVFRMIQNIRLLQLSIRLSRWDGFGWPNCRDVPWSNMNQYSHESTLNVKISHEASPHLYIYNLYFRNK